MTADRIQCWYTQLRHMNYRTMESGAGKGAGIPTEEPHPACLAPRCTTRLFDLGQEVICFVIPAYLA